MDPAAKTAQRRKIAAMEDGNCGKGWRRAGDECDEWAGESAGNEESARQLVSGEILGEGEKGKHWPKWPM